MDTSRKIEQLGKKVLKIARRQVDDSEKDKQLKELFERDPYLKTLHIGETEAQKEAREREEHKQWCLDNGYKWKHWY